MGVQHWGEKLIAVLFLLLLLVPEQCSPTTLQLLFANRRDLRSISLGPNLKQKQNSSIVISNLRDATSLDYSADTVCWSDIKTESIQCWTGNSSVTIADSLPAPEDVAIDWICGNLYWSDSDTNRIEVVGLEEPYHRRVLVYEDLDQPRAIVLDSNEGYLFWSDWGEQARIERVAMDGGGRRVLHSTSLVWPNGLSLDYLEKKLYWIDGKLLQIGFSDYDGSNRGRLDQSTSLHPFSLVYSSELSTLFWSDWNTNSLHYLQMNGSTQARTLPLKTNNLQPMDVVLKQDRMVNRTCGHCTHLCLLNPVNYTCTCPTGVAMDVHGRCKQSIETYLLIARSTEIRLLSLDAQSPDVDLGVKNLKHVLSIDQHLSKVYWTDDETRQVGSYDLSTKKSAPIITMEITHPDGLAIDHTSEQLYWTDAGTDKIEVCKIDGSYRRAIISRGLYEPRAIAIDTLNGLLFWSDWGRRPRIEKSGLDGSGRQVLISNEIEWPNGLALDEGRKILFFCDASTDRIESVNYDGSGRFVILQSSLPHPFGFSYSAPYLYWSDWQSRSVERIRYDGSDRKSLLEPFPDPMGVRAVGGVVYENSCKHSNCSQLCFYNGTSPNCACGNGFELAGDSSTCVKSEDYIIYNRNGDLYKLSNIYKEDTIHIAKLRQPVAVATDNKHIYWSEGKSKSIWRSDLNGWGTERIIEYTQHVECIYTNGDLLYWSDSSGGRIEVCTLKRPHFRKVLLSVESPKSIAMNGYKIYYSSWGEEPYIGVASANGADKKVYLKTNGRVNSLQFDNGWIYFSNVDGGTVERYDGVKKEVLARGGSPYAVVVWGEKLFYSDLATNQLIQTGKDGGGNGSRVLYEGVEVLDMRLHRSNSHVNSSCESSTCTHLCFETGLDSHLCSCPEHYELVNNNCTEPMKYLLVLNQVSILRYLNQSEVYLKSGLKRSRNRKLLYYGGKLSTTDEDEFSQILQGSLEFTITGGLVYYYRNSQLNVSGEGWSGSVYRKVDGLKNLLSNSNNLYFSIANVIYRLDLDGFGEIKLPTSVAVQQLAVDDSLYFYGEGGFYKSDLNLTSYILLFRIEPVAISKLVLFDNLLYYVTQEGSIESIHADGAGRRRLGPGREWAEGVVDVLFVDGDTSAAQPCRCSHICLTVGCSCPEGLVLKPDGVNCIKKMDQCHGNSYNCKGGPIACIPHEEKCDGLMNCRDGSDELDCCQECEGFECGAEVGPEKKATCPHCLHPTLVCDSIKQCPGGEDENSCPSSKYLYAAPVTVLIIIIIGVGLVVVCRRRQSRTKINRSYLNNMHVQQIGGTADTLLSQSYVQSQPYTPSPVLPPIYSMQGGPPPTPCSTDVCDESEVYIPPPPSPHTSSNSSRYYSGGGGDLPGAPPPSPVL